MLQFVPLSKYKSGLLFQLLSKSYKGLIENYHLPHKEKLIENWKKFDKEAFSNPKISNCVFITCIDDKPIGFASYDPRQGPEYGVIGHNCILPKYQGKGYGKKQILELLRRLKELHVKKARVSTGDHPFFISAHRLYLGCGFKIIDRMKAGKQDFPMIRYEMTLMGMSLTYVKNHSTIRKQVRV